MNQRTTLEVIAPTVEEAIAQGLSELGLTADAVSVEVLDAGNKGLFGLGKPQVRVRLTVNPPSGPGSVSMEVRTESVPKSQPEPERIEKKPEPSPALAPGAHLPRTQVPGSVDDTQDKPAPVKASPAVKEEELQPEHDALLDRTEFGHLKNASSAGPPGTGLCPLRSNRTRWPPQHPGGYSRQRFERVDRASYRNLERIPIYRFSHRGQGRTAICATDRGCGRVSRPP